jgi:general nucleoside transport system permease protein
MSDLAPFLEAAIRTATPLLIAAIGEAVSERAGVINIGLEGCIIAGAYAAFVSASGGQMQGYGAAVLAGVAVGVLLAVFSVVMRRDQIIVGTALTMLALGATGTLFRMREGAALVGHVAEPMRVPLLSDIPVVGAALFGQPAITYAAIGAVPLLWLWLYRTHAGLALRAVGEAPDAARAAGVRVTRIQIGAVLFGSALGGLAGGALVLAQAGSFAEGMSAGRGFLAIAIVALGRWRPVGVLIAALVFGAAMAMQFVVQALGWSVRYELVLMIPYVLTLAALGAFGRGAAPAMLGRTVQSE